MPNTHQVSRALWLAQLAAATAAFRRERANVHRDAQARCYESGDDSGADWHAARALGQLERFERVDACGTELWEAHCGSCAAVSHTIPKTCNQPRVCVACRGRRVERERARFVAARDVAVKRTAGFHVGGNRWRELFCTFTVPHMDVARDLAALYDAWPRFRVKYLAWLHVRLGVPRRMLRTVVFNDHGQRRYRPSGLPYVRVTEIGHSRSEGHVHFHFWCIAPYVHHSVLRRLWGEALRADYCPVVHVSEALGRAETARDRAHILESARRRIDSSEGRQWLPWPVVDVRSARNVETELVKYLVKDFAAEGHGELVDPSYAAEWFRALEGRRLLTAAPKLWLPEPEAVCQQCGTIGELRVRPADADGEGAERARGPPCSVHALTLTPGK